jgi:hypothetical protein
MRRTVLGLSIVLALASTGGTPTRAVSRAGRDSGSANRQAANGPESQAGLPGGWSAAVQDSIRQQEYEASRLDGAVLPGLAGTLQAPNRAQGFRTYFTPSGIEVVPRTDAAPSWTWGLDLARYGFEGNLVEAGGVEPGATENRVEYRRGLLTEWYVNDGRGLEQGFTFDSASPVPVGSQGPPPLVVELGLHGSLSPAMSLDGAIAFALPSGAVVRYGQLSARDATGRSLPAALALVRGGSSSREDLIRITVASAGAVFPVTIDPLAVSADWTGESNQPSAWYGYSVATAGDVNGDGYADVIVGAYRYDDGEPNEGAAFLYYGSAGGIGTTAAWMAESNLVGALFGHSVSTAGDVNGDGYADVIVGAPNPDHGTKLGLAYAYYGSPTGLPATADWTVEGDQLTDWFGRRVHTAGDVNGDGFDDVIVGVPQYDSDKQGVGKAVAYYGSATGLDTTADWTAIGTQVLALFGRDAKTAGDVNGDGFDDVIVGAHYYDHGQKNEGRAFLYEGSPRGLRTNPSWTAEGNQVGAVFGRSVSTAGDVNGDGYDDVIIGAPQYDHGQTNEGMAFAYYGSATGLSTTANWTAEGNQADAWFARSVATAGDVNGDGFADVIVGAPNFDTQQTDGGKVFVYYGSAAGLSVTANWTSELEQDHAWFGRSVSRAGDVNGDGFGDVIIGAPKYDDGQTDEGGAFAFYGSLGGLGSG